MSDLEKSSREVEQVRRIKRRAPGKVAKSMAEEKVAKSMTESAMESDQPTSPDQPTVSKPISTTSPAKALSESKEANIDRKKLQEAKQELEKCWATIFSKLSTSTTISDLAASESVLRIIGEQELKLDSNIMNLIVSKLLKAYLPILQNPQCSQSERASTKREIGRLRDAILQSRKVNSLDKKYFGQSIIAEIYAPILSSSKASEDDKYLAKEGIQKTSDAVLQNQSINFNDKRSFVEFVITKTYANILSGPESSEFVQSFIRKEVEKATDIVLKSQWLNPQSKYSFAISIISNVYNPILKNPYSSELDQSFARNGLKEISDAILKSEWINSGDKHSFATFLIEKTYAPILGNSQSSESDQSFAREEIVELSDKMLKSKWINPQYKESFAISVIKEAYVPILKDPQYSESDKYFVRENIREISSNILDNSWIDCSRKHSFAVSIIEEAYARILRDPQPSESDKSFVREETVRLLNALARIFIIKSTELDVVTAMMDDYTAALKNPASPHSEKLLSKWGEGGISEVDTLMKKYDDFVNYYKTCYTVPPELESHFKTFLGAGAAESLYDDEPIPQRPLPRSSRPAKRKRDVDSDSLSFTPDIEALYTDR